MPFQFGVAFFFKYKWNQHCIILKGHDPYFWFICKVICYISSELKPRIY